MSIAAIGYAIVYLILLGIFWAIVVAVVKRFIPGLDSLVLLLINALFAIVAVLILANALLGAGGAGPIFGYHSRC